MEPGFRVRRRRNVGARDSSLTTDQENQEDRRGHKQPACQCTDTLPQAVAHREPRCPLHPKRTAVLAGRIGEPMCIGSTHPRPEQPRSRPSRRVTFVEGGLCAFPWSITSSLRLAPAAVAIPLLATRPLRSAPWIDRSARQHSAGSSPRSGPRRRLPCPSGTRHGPSGAIPTFFCMPNVLGAEEY